MLQFFKIWIPINGRSVLPESRVRILMRLTNVSLAWYDFLHGRPLTDCPFNKLPCYTSKSHRILCCCFNIGTDDVWFSSYQRLDSQKFCQPPQTLDSHPHSGLLESRVMEVDCLRPRSITQRLMFHFQSRSAVRLQQPSSWFWQHLLRFLITL